MNLTKWKPAVELKDVANRLNSIFGRTPVRYESDDKRFTVADWAPSVDIAETNRAYLIKAEIPGVNKEDVKIILQDGMLTIQGERKIEKEESDKKYHRIERCYGSFARSFTVPDDADEQAITAEFKNGILNIALGKSAQAKSTEVKVSVT